LLIPPADAGLIYLARQFLQRFPPQETRMDKRILAVLIAAMTGTAYAQSSGYATNSSGTPLRDSAGAPVRAGGATAPSSTAASPRVAQSSTYNTAPASAATGATAPTVARTIPRDGYLVSSNGNVVVNSANHCVRTGSWSPDKAAMPCDAVPTASTPAPVAVAPQPEPAPAPIAQAAPETPAPPVLEKITLSTDVLFPFNKAELLPGGREKLDSLASDAKGAEVDKIVLAGYADRIGSEGYNRDLSERRAQAVAEYLASKGVDQSRIQVEGRGEDSPVTGDQCKRMGPEKASNKKLVSCLQPDRRVEAELLGSREASTGTPATGATSGAPSTGTSGSSGGGTSQ
jgi:OOP family OmpA-OmpF porin